MNIRSIPGAAYCDALPSGEYCALVIGSHIETHLGRIPLPPHESYGPLYLRCTNVGGFKFAGQAHDTGNPATWEYAGGEWRSYPPPCCGVSPLIYDHLGILHISDCSIGSQGWRYVAYDGTPEGRLVTGDQSYGPREGLSEFSVYDRLAIGQGHDGGGVVLVNLDAPVGQLRVLSRDNGRFVRVQGSSDQVAIAYWGPNGAVIVTATIDELRALPLASTPAPTPAPIPVPQPTPEPAPMSEQFPATYAASVARFVSFFPVPSGGPNPADEAFENRARLWTLKLAQQIKFDTGDVRVGVKNAGGGRPQSKDSIAVNGARLINYDMLSGVGTGSPTLITSPAGEDITGQTFMSVQAVDHVGGGRPPTSEPAPTTPPPAPFDPSSILARLALAEAQITALQHAEADALDQIHQLDGRTVKVGQLAGYAKKGDRVEVSGRISGFGVNKWGGTIL